MTFEQKSNNFKNEIQRCEYTPQTTHSNNCDFELLTYNGISYKEGVETYRAYLSPIYNEFREALYKELLHSKTDKSNVISALKAEMEKSRKYLQESTPSTLTLKNLKESKPKFKGIEDSIKEVEFIREMSGVQIEFIQDMIDLCDGYLKRNPDTIIYTKQDVLTRLQISENTLKRYMDEGYISFTQIPGGNCWFSEKDITEFMQNKSLRHEAWK